MLCHLKLDNVGPGSRMEMELAPRLNIITGDNGLGKSFLLDVAWWSLTRRWPRDLNPLLTSGYPARPSDRKRPARIGFELTTKSGKSVNYESEYAARDEAWLGRVGRPWNPGLVIYAHADGGFSVWDPARNYWKTRKDMDIPARIPGFVFSASDVWDGLEMEVDGKGFAEEVGAPGEQWLADNPEAARPPALWSQYKSILAAGLYKKVAELPWGFGETHDCLVAVIDGERVRTIC